MALILQVVGAVLLVAANVVIGALAAGALAAVAAAGLTVGLFVFALGYSLERGI